MIAKLAIEKESFEGRRISACIGFGLPLNILEVCGNAVGEVGFTGRESKEGYFIFYVAFIFTDEQKKKVAIFDRATIGRDRSGRLTKGTGVFCNSVPDLTGKSSFEEQILKRVSGVNIREVRILGQGVSHRGATTYLFTVINVTVEDDSPIAVNQSADQFVSFTDLTVVPAILGEGRDLDLAVLQFLQGQEFNKEIFIPSEINCWIQHNTIMGLDIYRFSTHPSDVQVLKYITLQFHIQRLISESRLTAYTIQTGDGCYIVFEGASEDTVIELCLNLHNRISLTNSTGNNPGDIILRYALHVGPVYKVLDLNRQANFIGDGINYCARLLGVKESNVLCTSEQFYKVISMQGLTDRMNFERRELLVKHKPEPETVFFLRF